MINFEIEAEQINIFDERWYKIPDRPLEYINVTELITGGLPKNKFIIEWLKNTKNPEEVIHAKGIIGSEAHNYIDQLFKQETQMYNPNYTMDAWERFVSWSNWFKNFCEEHLVKVIATEQIVFSDEFKFAGCTDMLAEVDTELTVLDWKTGAFIGIGAELQLSAYAHCVGAKKGIIVQINPEVNQKGYKEYKIGFESKVKRYSDYAPDFVKFPPEICEMDVNFESFKNTMRTYWDLNPMKKPKFKTLPLTINLKDLQ